MAEKQTAEHCVTCSVCLEVFKEPVTLGCDHSFCRSCVLDYWDQSQTRNCPVCRRRWSMGLAVNFALKEECESFTEKLKLSEKPKAEGGEERQQTKPSEDDEDKQQRFNSELDSLEEERFLLLGLERDYEKMNQFCKKQAVQCERQIKANFSRLQMFLQEEEQRVLTALREKTLRQNQSINQELQQVQDRLSSLNTSITDLEKQLKKRTLDYIRSTPRPLNPKAGLLLDQAKFLGNLDFRVWRKMRRIVSYSPVILDPNSANGRLYLSEDLRGVRWREQSQELPANPERFCFYASVLGSEGFSSGVHQWDVEVGDHPEWAIGVARESVNRDYRMPSSYDRKIWSLLHLRGAYSDRSGAPVSVRAPLQKLRVKLDYDLGEVSFYDADHMAVLLTYADTFTEKLFPFFSVLAAGDANTRELRVLA